jgi:hypothetical protein
VVRAPVYFGAVGGPGFKSPLSSFLFQCDADQRESVTCHCLGRTKMYKHTGAPTQGNGTPDQSHVRSIVRTICTLTPSLDSRLEHKLHLCNLRVPHSLSPVDVHLGKYMARTNRTLLPYPASPIRFRTFPDSCLPMGSHFRFVVSSCLTPNLFLITAVPFSLWTHDPQINSWAAFTPDRT